MARIVGGSMIGELSGKMGGMVFARNRGGQYIRAYAIPVNPNTEAQNFARDSFGLSSSNYHSLAAAIKTLWQNFAGTIFNPKKGIAGVPSGFNAYVALNNVIRSTQLIPTYDVDINAGPALVPVENVYSVIDEPPGNGLQPNFKGVTSGFYTMDNFGLGVGITTVGNLATFEINLNMDLTGSVGAVGGINSFKDAESNGFGFTVFMSNAVAQPGMFIQNPDIIKVGTFAGLSSFTAVAAPLSVTISTTTATVDMTKYHAFPQLGQFVRYTIYQTSKTGMMNKLYTVDMEITDEA